MVAKGKFLAKGYSVLIHHLNVIFMIFAAIFITFLIALDVHVNGNLWLTLFIAYALWGLIREVVRNEPW